MAALRRVLLLQRSVPAALRFYRDALGLAEACAASAGRGAREHAFGEGDPREDESDVRYAELDAGGGSTLALLHTESEAALSVGYSPMLSFDVDDLDTVVNAALRAGARLDGPIKYPPHGRAAALRAPDGHMIGLYEPAADAKPQPAQTQRDAAPHTPKR